MNNTIPQKKISVAMTTYNGGKFLRKQLDSILQQTIKVDEVIVGDDGSKDETLDILEEFAQKMNLRFFTTRENLGFVKNFEKTLSLCTGDLIFLADQDDIWFPDKVKTMVESIGDNLLIHSDAKLIDENDQTIQEFFKGEIATHQKLEDFLFANVVTGCTTLIDRKLLDFALPFPDGITYHDWYLAIQAGHKGKLKYISQPLIGYRQHTNQDTGSGVSEKNSILRNSLKRLQGKEFSALKSNRRQLSNLKAIRGKFKDDQFIHSKLEEVIGCLEDYVNNFFHFKFGRYYSQQFIAKDRSFFYRMFLQLKFSVG